MTDRLQALLERTADEWCADAVAPPLPADQRPRLRAARLAPLLAAAAVVAVVAPIAVVAHQDRPDRQASFATIGSPVAIDPRAPFRPDDAGLPAARRPAFARGPHGPACTASELTAVVDFDAGAVALRQPKGSRACLLPDDLHVDTDHTTGIGVVMRVQSPVTNPPDFDGRFLSGAGIDLNAGWSGDCAHLPTELTLVGSGLSVPAPVRGRPATCGPGAPVLRLEPAHLASYPGAVVPPDRAGLTVELTAPDEIGPNADFTYRVTMANPTDQAIALRPCPTYANTFRAPNGAGFGGAGRLPCEQLPVRLEPREQVVLVMPETSNTGTPQDDDSEGTASVTWQIAGTAAASTSVAVRHHPPKVLAPIPYAEPTSAAPAAGASGFTYHSTGAFPIVIQAPTTVRAGQTLHYRALFTNPEGRQPVPLRPCPAWTETFVVAPKVSHNPTPSVRRGALDCAHAPQEIGPNESVVFEMELPIPADTKAGSYQLFWQLLHGMDSAPFDLEVTD